MTSTVFGQIGPYSIERPIGQGGMASVFLARDTRTGRTVALKVVHTGTDEEAREILESEQRGADLQQRFSAISRFVPKVYESGFATDYFYIAMEYIAGEDLSQAIHRGPLPWERAVAIAVQLCEFLEEANRFELEAPEGKPLDCAQGEVAEPIAAEGAARHVLLHNDLKPRNIRLIAGDEIKVLDFGAAKALSLSRKVTRNDFGSTAYLSPECLESGDRDRHSDAWALGVLLYEMVRGRQPFRAGDTRHLEQRIRSRRAPEPIEGNCPPALEAIIVKLLAPYPADRYQTAAEIRADLARVQSGGTSDALTSGWLERRHDEPPTRRTQVLADPEPITRRTPRADAVVGAANASAVAQTADAVPATTPATTAAPARPRIPRGIRNAVGVVVIALALNESCVASRANRLAETVPLQDFAGLSTLWPQYEAVAGWSWLGGWGVSRLERTLAAQTMVLAERVMANYRSPLPTVRENQWKAAREALRRAVTLAPGDRSLRAALRYADGHLHRINGEASKARDQPGQAQQEFTEAIVAFREAATLRPNWPDPFLGLARTFIYGLDDVDRAADALAQAAKHGHHPGERETIQLADGYRARGDTLARTAQTLHGLPQEREYLSRATEAFREALTKYSTIPGVGNAAVSIRETQKRLDRIALRLEELSKAERMAMGVTYTRGRDLERRRVRRGSISVGELLLILTSAVTVLAIVLAYAGRVRAEAWNAPAGAPAPVNLNALTGAEALEAPLAAVFAYPADRQFVAKALAAWLRPGDGPRQVPNVGTLARIEVPVAAIDRDDRLVVLRERLEAHRRSAADAGLPRAESRGLSLPLLSPAELSAVKPWLSVRTAEEFARAVLWCAVAMIVACHFVSFVWRWRGIAGDRILLALAHLLIGIGFIVMLSRPDPLRDTVLLVRYTQGIVIGVALFGVVSLINIERAAFRELSYLPLIGALALSTILLVFGSGPGASNVKVNLGPVQPIEAIRLLLAIFLAGYFARRWELIRQVRTEAIRDRPLPRWVNLPRLDHLLPVGVGVGAALVLFFLLKDLGPALLLSLMFLSMFAVARGGGWIAGAGLVTLVAGFGIGYLLNVSNTLAARMQMWRSPWDTAIRGGDQVAQGLWGMAAGAVSGTGAGLGQTRFVPEGHTDLVLAAIGEELGLVGLLIVGAAFVLIAWRGMTTARRASSDYGFFLALAMTLSLAIPVLVMSSGILGVLPLTGVVTPFLSYGGSAMAANFVALGLLAALRRLPRAESRGRDQPVADLSPFRLPAQWLWRAAAAGAAAVVVAFATVQTLRADEYLVRPQLGVQADGGRRFQYNPRVLDALRSVPRGTIYDRRGLPLASSDPAIVPSTPFGRSGQACPNPAERCYPAGPSLFHVLGDATTRSNWSAANTSYVERDLEGTLRGFDDRATVVATEGRDGRASVAVRRNYAAAIPLVRHRYQPDHPEVRAILARSRDVRLTIDAQLQLAVAESLSRATRSSGITRGAVVVLDASTGEVLASVSYPWPGATAASGPGPRERTDRGDDSNDEWLDRARYGLYPPGSTFKMITAAAALREHPGFSGRSFMCQRLPSDRIGVRIPGFGRPIHDDVLDRHPHGRLEMHDAIVRSCNAYFAQLAVALGPDVLTRTAATAGIALNSSRSAERVRANLPHAGYGQGEVLVTPLRIARVAAALATDGVIREAPLAIGTGTTIDTPFVSPAVARTLSGYLRDAVVGGTGRLLRDHPARIAGKTGTAEVDEAASHAWFVGFAPFDFAQGKPTARRIAFAVVLEHAGYGGAAAAAVAGQIATAATAAGWTR